MNKQQGAEFLIYNDGKHAMLSLTISIVLLSTLLIYPMLNSWFLSTNESEVIKVKVKKVINYSELSAPPPIELEPIKAEPFMAPPKVKSVKFLKPVAKKDAKVMEDERVPTMEEMATSQIGTFDQDGIDTIIYNADEIIELSPEPIEEAYAYVQTMPEFKGGRKALINYLSTNISYPVYAKEAKIEGTVFVGFVVEKDGSITEAQIMKSVHDALDEEALRVIIQMPKWIPGIQNGETVRVKFTVPVKFKLIVR